MRQVFIIFFSLFNIAAFAQDGLPKGLFEFKNKLRLYYVDTRQEFVYVYEMGGYFDKAGSGYAISWTDTLTKQSNGQLTGRKSRLAIENGRYNLFVNGGKGKQKKYLLSTVHDMAEANKDLNNAYYLGNYFAVARALNEAYKLHHHSFRNGYYTWDSLPNKEMDYVQFRAFADQKLQQVVDSVSTVQDRYVATTNYIIGNLSTINYDRLKDSIQTLPIDYMPNNAYHGTAVIAIAKQKPEYFFRLAKDFPGWHTLMYYAVDRDKEAMASLKAMEGYADIKKAIFGRKM